MAKSKFCKCSNSTGKKLVDTQIKQRHQNFVHVKYFSIVCNKNSKSRYIIYNFLFNNYILIL